MKQIACQIFAFVLAVLVTLPLRAEDAPDFEKHIQPLLAARCGKCHGAAKQSGGLDLRTRRTMLAGGENGAAIVPAKSAESLLWKRVAAKEMPPEGEPSLSEAERALLAAWIDAGANAPDIDPPPAPTRQVVTDETRQHWSFRPLQRPDEPALADATRRHTQVDTFILARLQSQNLSLAPEADRAVLARRVYLDLLGLPPSPEEVTAFVQDTREDAYDKLLDKLLESPHFGERWGRQWLDNAGYVDVLGTDNDATIISSGENKWLYRDYVVRSFNADKPFDRFITEQLAGDELVDWRASPQFTDEIRELLVATGFLRISADDTSSPELNTPMIRHGVLQRTGETVAGNLLALTFGCAKCHDHKYEPIAHRDYYRFLAVLQPAFNPDNWLTPVQRQLANISPTEKATAESHNAELEQQIVALRNQSAELKRPYLESLSAGKLAALPEPIRADTQTALATVADKRNEVQKYLAGKFEAALKVSPEEVAAALSAEHKAAVAALDQQIAGLAGQKRTWQNLQVVQDAGPATPTHLLKRGNHDTPGEEVAAGGLSVLCASDSAADLPPSASASGSSGRRLALAQWLNAPGTPANGLLLRVRVNRVWQQLFGRGLVETADNLGVTGAAPSHPELLDWLACEFAAHEQRLKPFLKLVMTSSVYRQASVRPLHAADSAAGDPRAIDPDNRLLWRMPLRRLESEGVRDSILAVSGQLDRTLGGPPVPVESRPDGTFVVPEQGLPTPTSAFRRSLYLLARRNYHPTLLGVFDQPALTSNCTGRGASAVVLQSLTMLNDPFLSQQSAQFAERVGASAASPQPADLVERAFLLALNRAPNPRETALAVEQLQKHQASLTLEGAAPDAAARQALVHLCHVLFNTSEFLAIP